MSASQSVDQFVLQLKRRYYFSVLLLLMDRQVYGSNSTALMTAHLLRTVISNSRWNNAESLIQMIKEIAARLVQAQPVEFAVGNIVRRVLHLVREEYKANTGCSSGSGFTHRYNLSSSSVDSMEYQSNKFSTSGDSSIFNLLVETNAKRTDAPDYTKPCFPLKQLVIEGIREMIDELETLQGSLSSQSLEHIHSKYLISFSMS